MGLAVWLIINASRIVQLKKYLLAAKEIYSSDVLRVKCCGTAKPPKFIRRLPSGHGGRTNKYYHHPSAPPVTSPNPGRPRPILLLARPSRRYGHFRQLAAAPVMPVKIWRLRWRGISGAVAGSRNLLPEFVEVPAYPA